MAYIYSIVSDTENALVNSIKKYFPNSQRIAFYFHYTQDIRRNLKLYGLYKKEYKEIKEKVQKSDEKIVADMADYIVVSGQMEHFLSYQTKQIFFFQLNEQ